MPSKNYLIIKDKKSAKEFGAFHYLLSIGY
jgi:hypothetical protein